MKIQKKNPIDMTEEEKLEIYRKIVEGSWDKDIVVLENIHTVPCLNIDYHAEYFYIGMCTKGYSKGTYDCRDLTFSAGDIRWVVPDHILSHQYVSDDYDVISTFISKSLFDSLKQQGSLGKYHYLAKLQIVKLSPEIFEIIYNSFRLLGILARSENTRRDEMIAALVSIISTICDDFITQNVIDIAPSTNHEGLFEQFYGAICEHYRESREVSFYAGLACKTPKYFATVIKQTTGIPASDWINRYVIVEAKRLLINNRKKSIQQIAHYLGFSEQASFSRLFKRIEGITPSEFRDTFRSHLTHQS